MISCINCDEPLRAAQQFYCSNRCQRDVQYHKYIELWKQGKVNGGRGLNTRNMSGHLIRYLREKYQRCSSCGWDERNPVTDRVPLEIDHIDGNSENNTELNLRLICPNCHSLSSNFRNLNRGNGRAWRRLKYVRSK